MNPNKSGPTWGDLVAGSVILDKNDQPWEIRGKPELVLTTNMVRAAIWSDALDKGTVVAKPRDEPVTLDPIHEAQSARESALETSGNVDPTVLDAEVAKVQDAFGQDKVELLATETTEETKAREAATPAEPLRLPVIDHPASLRSHLYLVHDFYVADVDSTLALQEHHRKQHKDFPDQGTLHTHEEQK